MIYLALGGNQNALYKGKILSVEQAFRRALVELAKNGIETLSASHLWQSPAWPDPKAQPPYLNAVIAVKTELTPIELLSVIKGLEMDFGRSQTVKNAPRPLDIDILDYNGQVLQSGKLTLPHPRMLSRAFVLFPLAEIAPDWSDPIKKRAIHDWIARLDLGSVTYICRLNALF